MKNKMHTLFVIIVVASTSALLGGEIDLTGEYSGNVKTMINSNFPMKMLQKLTKEQKQQMMKSQGKHEINISIKVVVKKIKSDSGRKWKFICKSTLDGKSNKWEFLLNEKNGQVDIVPAINKRDLNEGSKMMLCAIFGALIPAEKEFEISDSFILKPASIKKLQMMATFKKIEIKKSTNDTFTLISSEKKNLGKMMGNEQMQFFQDNAMEGKLKLVSGKLTPQKIQLDFSSKAPTQTVLNTITIKRVIKTKE